MIQSKLDNMVAEVGNTSKRSEKDSEKLDLLCEPINQLF